MSRTRVLPYYILQGFTRRFWDHWSNSAGSASCAQQRASKDSSLDEVTANISDLRSPPPPEQRPTTPSSQPELHNNLQPNPITDSPPRQRRRTVRCGQCHQVGHDRRQCYDHTAEQQDANRTQATQRSGDRGRGRPRGRPRGRGRGRARGQ